MRRVFRHPQGACRLVLEQFPLDEELCPVSEAILIRNGITEALCIVGRPEIFEERVFKAVQLIRAAQRQDNKLLKVEAYLGALEALQNSSLKAETDDQLSQTLKQRDVLLKVLPDLVVNNCQMTILSLQQSGQEVSQEKKEQLLRHLSFAQRYAAKEAQLQKIESLQNILK